MNQPDILFFMSDQHTPYFSGFYGNNVDTPAMDQLCRDGIQFNEAYTVCPLCVPARAAMLTGIRPARTGIFTLEDAIPDMTPTFLHNLVEQGYETVLCGRMHFVGEDQRHGFVKRIADDMTTISWNVNRAKLKELRGVFVRSFGEKFCTTLVGGGESPVDYYDEYVIQKAIEYLSIPHEKPQFLAVSLYAPHFPYVGPKERYEKYRKTAKLPESFYDKSDVNALERHYQKVDEDLELGVIAAYSAMIEQLDERMGRVRAAFDDYCKRHNRKKLFIYTSDHGDQVGDRSMFGKSTFYEKSAKIPLIMAGDGVVKDVVKDTPVNIMDIGPTILDYVGATPMMDVDGVTLRPALEGKDVPEHVVYGEFLEREDMTKPADQYCFMIKSGPYKYMKFQNEPDKEMLFHTVYDPEERNNLIKKESEIANQLRALAKTYERPEQSVRLQARHTRNTQLWKAYESVVGAGCDKERWNDNPEIARDYPEICVTERN